MCGGRRKRGGEVLPLLDGFLEGPRQAALARSRTTSPANAAAAVLAATTAAAACAVAGLTLEAAAQRDGDLDTVGAASGLIRHLAVGAAVLLPVTLTLLLAWLRLYTTAPDTIRGGMRQCLGSSRIVASALLTLVAVAWDVQRPTTCDRDIAQGSLARHVGLAAGRPLALLLAASVTLVACGSGSAAAARTAEANSNHNPNSDPNRTLSESESPTDSSSGTWHYTPPAAASAAADAALRRATVSVLPRPMLRAAVIAAVVIELGLAVDVGTSVLLLVARRTRDADADAACLVGALPLALAATALVAHLLTLSLPWAALWELDWATGEATAKAALGSGSSGSSGTGFTSDSMSHARCATLMGSTAPLVRSQVAAFDWSAFPDDSDEEGEATETKSRTAGAALRLQQNLDGNGDQEAMGLAGAESGSHRSPPTGSSLRETAVRGASHAEYETTSSIPTSARERVRSGVAAGNRHTRGDWAREPLYTVTQPEREGDEVHPLPKLVVLGGEVVLSHDRASEEMDEDGVAELDAANGVAAAGRQGTEDRVAVAPEDGTA